MHVFPDLAAACHALAADLARQASDRIAQHGRFGLVVPGGESPRGLFQELSGRWRAEVPWSGVDLFWSDERAVEPEDDRSNYRVAVQALLPLPGLAPSNIHRIHGEERPLATAARGYEWELHRWGGATPKAWAGFDAVVLGVGPDGHTASLFPGSATLEERENLVAVEPWPAREPKVPRITLTLRALAGARRIAFLASGADKAEAIARSTRPAEPGVRTPASLVEQEFRPEWYLDEAAASGL
ncbi:MAG: 6-phosphogluconolactonase [Thermoplasmata archaeon]|nr:6-phosphogluconolactonase [Thermoplasmata archaeon]